MKLSYFLATVPGIPEQLLIYLLHRLLSSREIFSRYFTRNDENQVVLNEQPLGEARDDDLFTLLWDISNIARSRHPTEVDLDTALALLEDRVRWKEDRARSYRRESVQLFVRPWCYSRF
jgi:hypothetical protein